LVVEQGGDRDFYYAKGRAGTLTESGASWNSGKSGATNPFRDGTWMLRWDAETAVVHLWTDGYSWVTVRGQADPCQ
jgi:hypothetical protein